MEIFIAPSENTKMNKAKVTANNAKSENQISIMMMIVGGIYLKIYVLVLINARIARREHTTETAWKPQSILHQY